MCSQGRFEDMKIKELLREIEIANKLNSLVENNKIQLVFEDETYNIICFDNYKTYLKYLKETYIDEVVDLMKNVDVELNTKQTLSYYNCVLGQCSFSIEFTLEQKRF